MPNFSNILIRTLLSGSSSSGRKARLSILMFHRVLAAPDPLFPGEIDARRFEEILIWLREWCQILPLREAVEMLRKGHLPTRAACITFDDGYADNYTQALPLLKRYGVHATFFIATGFLEGGRMWNDTLIESIRRCRLESIDLRDLGYGVVQTQTVEQKRLAISTLIPKLKYLDSNARGRSVMDIARICGADLPDDLMLTRDQLQALHSSGMGIGAHTVNHPILARCPYAVSRQEIADSKAILEELVGERIGLFAYPNGKAGLDYLQVHADMAAELGFDAALSTNSGASRHGDDLFQLRRFTPWDRERWRFAARLAQNIIQTEKSSRIR